MVEKADIECTRCDDDNNEIGCKCTVCLNRDESGKVNSKTGDGHCGSNADCKSGTADGKEFDNDGDAHVYGTNECVGVYQWNSMSTNCGLNDVDGIGSDDYEVCESNDSTQGKDTACISENAASVCDDNLNSGSAKVEDNMD